MMNSRTSGKEASLATLATRRLGALWQGLAPREQRAVQLSAWVVGLGLLWWLGLAPAVDTLRQASARHALLDKNPGADAGAGRQRGGASFAERDTTAGPGSGAACTGGSHAPAGRRCTAGAARGPRHRDDARDRSGARWRSGCSRCASMPVSCRCRPRSSALAQAPGRVRSFWPDPDWNRPTDGCAEDPPLGLARSVRRPADRTAGVCAGALAGCCAGQPQRRQAATGQPSWHGVVRSGRPAAQWRRGQPRPDRAAAGHSLDPRTWLVAGPGAAREPEFPLLYRTTAGDRRAPRTGQQRHPF